MNASSWKDRAYRITMTVLLSFSAVALAAAAYLHWVPGKPDPRLVEMPSAVVRQTFEALKQGDLSTFTEHFVPQIRDHLREDPAPFRAVWPEIREDRIEILGEGIQGDDARVQARYRVVLDGKAEIHEVVHTLRWDGKRWRIVRWRVPYPKKAPGVPGEPRDRSWELA